MLIFSAFVIGSWAVVSDYTFTSSTGTYTEISGGTVLLTGVPAQSNPSFNAIPLGFTFEFDGNDYTTVSIAENGFLAMGDEVSTSNLAISSSSGTNNAVVALNRNLIPRADGEIMYLLSGTAPNRTFTVQWKNFRRDTSLATNDILNFQIQLHEDANEIIFAYGATTAMTVNTAATVQVGLRGASNDDYNNRTTSTDWTATEAGTSNSNNCRLSAEVFPPNGLTFSFSPAQQGNPPMPAQTPSPAHMATNISTLTALSWQAGGGLVDGYKVYLGTNTPPSNIVNGTTQTNTIYQITTALNYNTQYYWQIVPFNADGDAVDCPVWSFTTLADPTISTYPYVENFDNVTPPALPLGWLALNQNNDDYSWASYNDSSAQTAPNAMRIRYNDTMAMNDWLVSVPLILDAEFAYRIKFHYRAHVATQAEKLALYMGTSPTAAAMTTELWSNENITNVNYQLAEVNIPANTGGTYYLGFHGYSPANRFYIYVDSFSVTEMEPVDDLYPPSNLHASVVGNDVHLGWEAPVPPPTGEWITWCNPAALGNAVGTDGAATFDVAHRFAAADLTGFHGSALTHVQFVPNEVNCVYTVKIWTGTAATQPSTLVHSQAVASPVIGQWNEVLLNTPIPIPVTGEFWIGYESNTQAGFPAGCDAGPQVEGKGNMINMGGWSSLTAVAPSLTYNWSIQGYVDHQARALVSMPEGIVEAPRAPQTGVLSMMHNPTARAAGNLSRNSVLTGYNIYRDGTLAGTVNDPAILIYTDENLNMGSYSYTVTAVYDAGESEATDAVEVAIEELDAPTDLAATVVGNDVTLDWTSPQGPQTGEWVSWSDNSAIGNSIGTDGAANFDVAHRFDATDLAAHVGNTLTQMKFVPMYQNAVYTVKIWTGGSATAPGTLVHSQVANHIIENWTTVILTNPVPITSGMQLWVGYNVNTQGGFPAGCDNGPQFEGKGNMMNFGGWTTLSQVSPTLTYNWLIQSFMADGARLKNVAMPAIAEQPLQKPSGELTNKLIMPARNIDRAVLMGYRVYRDGSFISAVGDPETTTYTDMDLPNGDYVYGVSAVYNTGESLPATIDVNVNLELGEEILFDSFEEYADFATDLAPWTLLDQDGSNTYGFTDISFPGSESPMAYIAFNPASTVPPITGMDAFEGDKMAASFAAVTPPNNDWMVTPQITLGTNSSLKFMAKSHTANYGLERFRVGVSTMPMIIVQGFQYLSGTDYVEAPAQWTEFSYDLSAYDGQEVYIAIRCVSNDAFVFYVDNFSVHSDGGFVDNEDEIAPAFTTALQANYPNPFNPTTTIRYSVKDDAPVAIEIYNLKGQKVKTLVSESKTAGEHTAVWNGTDDSGRQVSTGVYFYKMNAGKYSATRKMIMMK